MNNLKKQILSAVVAASAVLPLIPSATAAIPSDVQNTRYEEPVQILSALNIMVGDENGEFRLDDTIIRSEVTKMAVHAMGLEDAAESAKGQTMFNDVSTDHWANGYINLAVSQGLLVGDGDGNFRPNDPITYAEAMVIMVKATGYGISAEQNGGYPYGYINTGVSNGLAKNVQGSAYEGISRGNVAYLTSNALEVELMEQTGFGSNIKYEVTDKTLLKDHLKVTKGSGQITAVENTSLSGDSNLGSNHIKIGNETFETAYNMNNLLGYNVNYYLKETNGSNEIILAMPIKSQNSDLFINADLFDRLTTKNGNTAVEYYKDENTSKTSTAQISSKAVLIYNGKYADMDETLIDMSNKAGSLTLLDTDKDGKYDIVFVKSYENIVVDKVTSSKITDKYSDKILKLDDNVDYRITKGLEEISVSDLREYDVLSVYESLDNKLFEIAVTNKTVKGKVTSSDSKGVSINGEKYQIALNYPNSIEVGTNGVFHLDIDGKIAASNVSTEVSANYGYLVRAYYSRGSEDKASFRIFTKDNKEVTLDSNSKIKFNGTRNVQSSEVVSKLNDESDNTLKQLITYTVNSDNKITAIDTAVDNSSTGNVLADSFTKNYELTDAVYAASLSKLGNVRIDDKTVIFDVSEGEDKYSIRNKSFFEDDQAYDAIVYDMTENYTAKAIVLTKAQYNAEADASIAVVKNIMNATNDEDETTDMLSAFVDGKEVSLYAADKNILVKDDKALENGDIIQYRTNSDKEIVSVRVLFDISTADKEFTASPEKDLDIVYGQVTKKFSNSLNISVNGGAASNYIIPEKVNVYSVDTTISKNNISAAEFNDIQVYDEDENNRIFLRIFEDTVKEIVIVK